MAAYFEVELDYGNYASTITVQNDKAKGFISTYQIFSGLSVWVYNIEFSSDFQVNLGLSENRPYYFSYNVKGHFLHQIGKQNDHVQILQNQSMIFIGSPHNSVQIIFPGNTKLEIAVITVDTNLLGALDIRNAKRIHSRIKEIFHKIPADLPYRHLGEIDPETGKFASIVCENNEVDLIGGLLTEGAVLNMLASQLKAYSATAPNAEYRPSLNQVELSKITSLGSYVLENLDKKITIDHLSAVFQLSPKKLQLGVKHLYGETVGHYILNLRLGQARRLFHTTDYNVSEVCLQAGLSSQSYFSKAFKSRHGISPSAYRKRVTS